MREVRGWVVPHVAGIPTQLTRAPNEEIARALGFLVREELIAVIRKVNWRKSAFGLKEDKRETTGL